MRLRCEYTGDSPSSGMCAVGPWFAAVLRLSYSASVVCSTCTVIRVTMVVLVSFCRMFRRVVGSPSVEFRKSNHIIIILVCIIPPPPPPSKCGFLTKRTSVFFRPGGLHGVGARARDLWGG